MCMYDFLKRLALGRIMLRECLDCMSREALSASYLLWVRRDPWEAGEGKLWPYKDVLTSMLGRNAERKWKLQGLNSCSDSTQFLKWIKLKITLI